MLFIVFYFVLNTIAATCTGAQASCKPDKCEALGDSEICTECKEQGNVPINGVCKTHDSSETNTAGCKNGSNSAPTTEVKCTKCTGDKYFLFMGGCYNQASLPGSTICTATADGECTSCAVVNWLFENPTDPLTTPGTKCILCSDTIGDGTTKGIAHCATCTAPDAKGIATCNICGNGYYKDDGGACQLCTSPCATCSGAGTDKCTSCKESGGNEYLRIKDSQSRTGECVAQSACTGESTHFLVTDIKTCYPCGSVNDGGIEDCLKCTANTVSDSIKGITVKCSACTSNTNKPNVAGTKCVACTIEECARCNDDSTCAECTPSNYLTPTNECTDDCEKLSNYYSDDNKHTCQSCDPGCTLCLTTDKTKCTACPAGKMLKYDDDTHPDRGGSCVDECKEGTNGCEVCGAIIKNTKYCSKCKTATEVPVNGVCTADNTRAPACLNKDNQGSCTTCANGYFRQDGGCYKTDRQPGMQVCSEATGGNGLCVTCTNTLPANNGLCPTCPDGCAKCTGAPSSRQCSTCYSGYYLSGTVCVRCTESSNNGNAITGVADCLSCKAPNGAGTVTCYVKKDGSSDGGNDNTDGNVNQSGGGLSTGAIAGISVAAIVVVGGLVGFLCWWFICRGKA
ncbi:VSP [Giardia lamblia P15]|uniref:VSP n=1 Tax=Giardia intestinalis (strain P15) TaxID=658858 RepID=E1F225_GIAIA|nr:VSP [Giardia lamblia P15]